MRVTINRCPVCDSTKIQNMPETPFFQCETCGATYEPKQELMFMEQKPDNDQNVGKYSIEFTIGNSVDGKRNKLV